MTPKTRTLLIILAFVLVTLGSFIWFIASWDPARTQSVVWHHTYFAEGIA